MRFELPRLVIAGLSGDSGKTIVCLSAVAALRRRGLRTAVFKKGPDYIDSAWLGKIAGRSCYNLDTFMAEPELVWRSFVSRSSDCDIAVVEGNRGIFDGRDESGVNSTAELAKLIQSPVVLVINAAKTTRTIAALLKGCLDFDKKLQIKGVILNKVAGARHRKVIQESIAKYCGIPVLGAIPSFTEHDHLIPQRHLGLIPPDEFGKMEKLEEKTMQIGGEFIEIDELIKVAAQAPAMEIKHNVFAEIPEDIPKKARIGYFADSSFTFYYPENLEALRRFGAELIAVSPLDEPRLPELDGLYIGGGFPETHAARLASNKSMMESVRQAAESGMPIYAECGGLIYLSKSLELDHASYPMASILNLRLGIGDKPAGHGYEVAVVDKDNPYYERGTIIKGHEFHYTYPLDFSNNEYTTCLGLKIGTGLGGKRDGIVFKNSMASYLHIHAEGVKSWAPAFVQKAIEYKQKAAAANRLNSENKPALKKAL